MWGTIGAAITGLLAVAGAADWFSWHRRTVAALKARAELANSVLDSQGQRVLREHLDRELVRFVAQVERRDRLRVLLVPAALLACGCLIAGPSAMANLSIDGHRWWLTTLTWIGVSLELCGVAALRSLERRMQSDKPQLQLNAIQERLPSADIH